MSEQDVRDAAPTVECQVCLDSGWERFECTGDDCGRRRPHPPHAYVRACTCRPMNRTYQERQARSSRVA